ncbi:hypothetical protein Bbelb_177270 [Branchiostoma belcheri]|nr:hypothetical protein Bbelb_177270 [Branchiostoma belcheri]
MVQVCPRWSAESDRCLFVFRTSDGQGLLSAFVTKRACADCESTGVNTHNTKAGAQRTPVDVVTPESGERASGARHQSQTIGRRSYRYTGQRACEKFTVFTADFSHPNTRSCLEKQQLPPGRPDGVFPTCTQLYPHNGRTSSDHFTDPDHS